MKLHRFNVIDQQGNVIRDLVACATNENDARTIAAIKLEFHFPVSYPSLRLDLLGAYSTLSHNTKEHTLNVS